MKESTQQDILVLQVLSRRVKDIFQSVRNQVESSGGTVYYDSTGGYPQPDEDCEDLINDTKIIPPQLDEKTARAILIKLLQAYTVMYGTCAPYVQPLPHLPDASREIEHTLVSSSRILHLMSFWIRSLTYRVENKPCFDLPGGHGFRFLDADQALSEHCIYPTPPPSIIARRLLYLQQKKLKLISPLSHQQLQERLDPIHHWAIDPALFYGPRIEWQYFLAAASYLFYFRREFSATLICCIEKYNRVRPYNRISVASFTTEHTAKAMESDEPDCPVCFTAYSHGPSTPTVPDNNVTTIETAVKTRCNHVVGAECLQVWVDAGHESCMICRQHLFCSYIRLPDNLRNYFYETSTTLYAGMKDLESEIDVFLLQGYKETHGKDFEVLLNKLVELVMILARGKAK